MGSQSITFALQGKPVTMHLPEVAALVEELSQRLDSAQKANKAIHPPKVSDDGFITYADFLSFFSQVYPKIGTARVRAGRLFSGIQCLAANQEVEGIEVICSCCRIHISEGRIKHYQPSNKYLINLPSLKKHQETLSEGLRATGRPGAVKCLGVLLKHTSG